MSWEHYLLVFRLKSPLHIGLRKVGNLMQTRPYVPGRVLWGALTARLVRDYHPGADNEAYRQIGEDLKQNFRFGYLWPALSRGSTIRSLKDLRIYFPWKEENKGMFDFLFLDCYASTALDHGYRGAEEGTLHHVEFIRPYIRSSFGEESRPVYLAGDIFVKKEVGDHSTLRYWPKALAKIQLGGERAYGWGRVELVYYAKNQKLLEIEGKFLINQDTLEITANKETYLFAHLEISESVELRGPVEVLTGYHTQASGEIRLIQNPPITLVPGTKVSSGSKFILSENPGLWKSSSVG